MLIEISPGTWLSEPEVIKKTTEVDGPPWAAIMPSGARHHLTEDEYQQQVREARVQAALLLRQQQQVHQTVASLDETLEGEIRRALAVQDQRPDGAARHETEADGSAPTA